MAASLLTKILYYSMLPAIGLVALIFTRGRLRICGHYDLHCELLGSFGVVFFHVLLAGWELCHRPAHQRSSSIAKGLCSVYILHIFFQIFFVDDESNHEGSWSVASKYWGVPTKISMSLAWLSAIAICSFMMGILLTSFWTIYPDSIATQPLPFDWHLVRQRMKDTLNPAILLVWLWFGLGHSVLGAGFGWGGMILLMLGVFIFPPFHYILWYRARNHDTLNQDMARALLIYYALHFGCQIFQWEGFQSGSSAASMYFGLSDEASSYTVVGIYVAIFVFMIYIMVLSYREKHHPIEASHIHNGLYQQVLNAEIVQEDSDGD